MPFGTALQSCSYCRNLNLESVSWDLMHLESSSTGTRDMLGRGTTNGKKEGSSA